jgi:uncharacterized protein
VNDAALPAAGESRELLLDGGAGRIDALLSAPTRPLQPAAFMVVCHPHPLYGGAMTNKVTYTLASTAAQAGLWVLRFNFRGVGRSQGRHDGGHGETDDTVALVNWMSVQLPGARAVLAGFSFGAFISLKAAARTRPQALISVAPPFKYFAQEAKPPRPDCPWLVVHGRDDEVVAYEDTRKQMDSYDPPPQLVALDGVGHYFHGRLTEIRTVVRPFLQQHLAADSA